MKIVFIPQHLYVAIKKADLRSQDLTDVEKLLSTLSPVDVAFYLYANLPGDKRVKQPGCPIPAELRESLGNILIDDATTPIPGLEKFPDVNKALNTFLNNNGEDNPSFCDETAVLTSDCMDEDLLIITHYTPAPAEDDKTSNCAATEALNAFYDRVIRQLLMFIKPEQVMAMPVLAGWMKSVKVTA